MSGRGNLPLRPRVRRQPGQAQDSAFWLTLAMLINARAACSIRALEALSGYSHRIVYQWMIDRLHQGWVTDVPGPTVLKSQRGPKQRWYQLTIAGSLHAWSLIRAEWPRWRIGALSAAGVRERPQVRYLLATRPWTTYRDRLLARGIEDFAVGGITVLSALELSAAVGAVPTHDFLTTAEGAEAVRAIERCEWAELATPGMSRITVLPPGHVLFRLVRIWRKPLTGPTDWLLPSLPAPIAALDCLDDPDPRVRQVAEATAAQWQDELARVRVP